MSYAMSEDELELEQELEAEFEAEFEDEFETAQLAHESETEMEAEEFYRKVARRAKRRRRSPALQKVGARAARAVLGGVGRTLIDDIGIEDDGDDDDDYDGEFETLSSALRELNPVRKVYSDAMLEHLGHAAASAESEDEAVNRMLPLIPMMASKLGAVAMEGEAHRKAAPAKVVAAPRAVGHAVARAVGHAVSKVLGPNAGHAAAKAAGSTAAKTTRQVAARVAAHHTAAAGHHPTHGAVHLGHAGRAAHVGQVGHVGGAAHLKYGAHPGRPGHLAHHGQGGHHALAPTVHHTVMRAAPQLTRGIGQVTRTLYRNPATRPLVHVIPTIARRTTADIARQIAHGHTVSPRQAVKTLARQTAHTLGSPKTIVHAWKHGRKLDHHLHRHLVPGGHTTIHRYGQPGSYSGHSGHHSTHLAHGAAPRYISGAQRRYGQMTGQGYCRGCGCGCACRCCG